MISGMHFRRRRKGDGKALSGDGQVLKGYGSIEGQWRDVKKRRRCAK